MARIHGRAMALMAVAMAVALSTRLYRYEAARDLGHEAVAVAVLH